MAKTKSNSKQREGTSYYSMTRKTYLCIAIALALIGLVFAYQRGYFGTEEPTIFEAAQISITADSMSPTSVGVNRGGVVTWTNESTTPKTLTFEANEDYSSDALQPHDTFSMTFDETGEYKYSDGQHSGIIHVE